MMHQMITERIRHYRQIYGGHKQTLQISSILPNVLCHALNMPKAVHGLTASTNWGLLLKHWKSIYRH